MKFLILFISLFLLNGEAFARGLYVAENRSLTQNRDKELFVSKKPEFNWIAHPDSQFDLSGIVFSPDELALRLSDPGCKIAYIPQRHLFQFASQTGLEWALQALRLLGSAMEYDQKKRAEGQRGIIDPQEITEFQMRLLDAIHDPQKRGKSGQPPLSFFFSDEDAEKLIDRRLTNLDSPFRKHMKTWFTDEVSDEIRMKVDYIILENQPLNRIWDLFDLKINEFVIDPSGLVESNYCLPHQAPAEDLTDFQAEAEKHAFQFVFDYFDGQFWIKTPSVSRTSAIADYFTEHSQPYPYYFSETLAEGSDRHVESNLSLFEASEHTLNRQKLILNPAFQAPSYRRSWADAFFDLFLFR